MNAIQFIKEQGVEKAREVIDGAPDKTATHYVFRKIPSYYSVGFQSWYHDGEWWDSDCHTEQDLIDSYGEDYVVNLSDLKNLIANIDSQIAIKFIKEWGDDYSKKYIALSESEGNILPWELSLKRLVESVDLVNCNGGWNGTKNTITLFQSSLDLGLYHGVDGVDAEVEIPRLKQAIADYEQLFGNTETSELETIRDCNTNPNCKKFDERVK